MNQYLEIFIEESKENLQNMNQSLLELEQNHEDIGLVHEIFRIAHTLKGMSGTMGFVKVAKLTHEMENVLQLLRSKEREVSEEIVDILFKCLDTLDAYINEIVESGEEGNLESEHLVEKLNAIIEGNENIGSVSSNETDSEKIEDAAKEMMHTELEKPLLNRAVKALQEGYFCYKMGVNLNASCMLKAARAFIVFSTLEKECEILKSNPSMEDIENEEFDSSFDIIFISKLKKEDIKEQIEAISEVESVWIEEINLSGPQEPIDISLEEFSKNIAVKASREGYNCYKMQVNISPECMLKAARAFIVFNTLEKECEILKSDPPVEDIEDEKFDSSFDIIFISKLEEEDLKEQVRDISEIESVFIEKVNTSEFEEQEYEVRNIENDTKNIQKEKEIDSKSNKKTVNKAKKPVLGKTVRVDIDRLDNLMNLVSELIITRSRLEDVDGSGKKQNMHEALEYLERITTNLHDAVMKVRMVPIERVFNRFPRMVRDLSKELGKEISLIMSGEETEVDRTVIDEIADPLIHLLRNSIDHGIEDPKTRINNGKSEIGTVQLVAYPDGNSVVIEVKDDGQGINIEKVKEKAIQKGVITREQSEIMEDKEAIKLLFESGFSTADQISDVSGRGVGLDVVKTKIESLGGIVEVETSKTGSIFTIRLPLTLAIIQALLVNVGVEKYAIPLNSIKEIITIKSADIRKVQSQEVVLFRNTTLPIIRMNEILSVDSTDSENEELTVVVGKKGDRTAGFVVDDLIGQQEIVIKSLGKFLSNIKSIAGATILGNGQVALIVDTNSLF